MAMSESKKWEVAGQAMVDGYRAGIAKAVSVQVALGCTCKERDCIAAICQGGCGCQACHEGYQDFLSMDHE